MEFINVFVYGSLKKDGLIRGMQESADKKFLGSHTTLDASFDLIELHDLVSKSIKIRMSYFQKLKQVFQLLTHDSEFYPAVIYNGKHKIYGEVWSVSPKVLTQLDEIECFPHLYDRKFIKTSAGEAWIYILQPNKLNNFNIKKLACSDRIKRISKTTLSYQV